MTGKRTIIEAITLAALIALSGCSPHTLRSDEYPLEMPAAFRTSGGGADAAATKGTWWDYFGDDALSGLIEEALRNNLDLAQAFERFRQAQALFRSTDAARGLQGTMSGAAGRARQPGIFGAETADTYRLSAAAAYELDVWEKLSSRSRAAHLDEMASRHDVMALSMSIAATAADLYYLAVEQRAQRALLDKTIDSYRDTLAMIERRYREGIVPALDVYQARQSLAAAEAQQPVLDENIAVTRNALSVIAGRFPGENTGGERSVLAEVPLLPAGLPSDLVMRRPDIQAALLRLKASDERIGAAVADRFPSFSLTGSYGGASDRLKSVLDSPNIVWNLLLEITQPLLDGGRRRSEVERSEAVFRERLAGYHKAVLEAYREVEDALAKNRSAAEQIALLRRRVSAAEDELRISLDNYLQGLSDYLPVLTAQRRYHEAESLLIAAQRSLVSARVALARAVGGDWMETQIERRMMSAGDEKEEGK